MHFSYNTQILHLFNALLVQTVTWVGQFQLLPFTHNNLFVPMDDFDKFQQTADDIIVITFEL